MHLMRESNLPIFVTIHDGRKNGVKIGACAYREQDTQEERLKVK
jgi:hypothetical protein